MAGSNLGLGLEELLGRVCEKRLEMDGRDLKDLRGLVDKLVKEDDLITVEYVCERLEKSVNFDNLIDLISDFYYTISLYYKKQQLLNQSLRFSQKSLNYSQKFDIYSLKSAKFSINLASILSKLGQHYSSIIYLKDALEILNSLNQYQSAPEINDLILIALFNLGAEAENTKDYEKAYIKYRESLSFMNFNIFPPPELLSLKISSSLARIQKLMKAKTPTPANIRQRSSSRINNLSSANTMESRPQSKSIKSLTRGTSKVMSPDIYQTKDPDKTAEFPFGKNSSVVNIKKLERVTTRIPDCMKPKKNIYKKGEVKELSLDTDYNYIQEKKPNPADISAKKMIAFETSSKIKTEIKPALNDIIKSESNYNIAKESEAERKYELNTKTLVTEIAQPTCIMTSQIEIDMIFYDIKYFFIKNMTSIEILLSNPESNYKYELAVAPSNSIFDFITKEIEPRLIIKEGNISLEQPKSILLAKGMFINESSSGSIKLSRYYPRWKIEVEINNKSKTFEMIDIKNHFPHSVDFTKDLSSLIAFFTLDSKEIQMNMVMAWPLEKIYESSIENDYIQSSIDLLIKRVNYLHSHSYLIMVKDSLIQPLLIENKVICVRTDRIVPTLNETINFLVKSIRINNCNQLELVSKEEIEKKMAEIEIQKRLSIYKKRKKVDRNLDKAKIFSNLQSLHDGINIARTISILQDSPTQSNLIQSPLKKSRSTEENPMMMKSILTDKIDLEDRIILRTCLSRNNTLYQICMSLSKGETLNFYIRKGSEVENLNKFSILVSLICEKTGLSKDLLIPLGSYVLRNMLIIKDSDICYFDFSKPITNPGHAIDKISSLFKALYTRKRVNLKLKNLAGKRKFKLDGLIYTCLVYIGNEALYVRFVRGAEVLSLDVSIAKVVKDGHFSSIDKFFKSLVSLGLRIVDQHGKRVLEGLEKYRLN